MKIKPPSPAMGVALTALVMASTGTAVAAVSYATNAGKVDGKDAVSAKVSNSRAAGDLVATASGGSDKGKIPAKFLGGVQQGSADSFRRFAAVTDNATDVASTIATLPGMGALTATCSDQNTVTGNEDPRTQVTFNNTSGSPISASRTLGGASPEVTLVQNGTSWSSAANGGTTFQMMLEVGGNVALIDGAVREEGRATADARCYVYGAVQIVTDNR